MKEQLLQLVDLQNIDSRIYDIRAKLQKLPDQLKKLKEEFEPRYQKHAASKEALKAKEAENMKTGLDQTDNEGKLQDLHKKLSNVKKARELNAVDSEINTVKKALAELQTRKVKLAEEIDNLQKELKEEEQIIQEQEKNIAEIEAGIEKENQETAAVMENLKKERDRIAGSIPPELLDEYEFIFEKKAGKAIVAVKAGVCTGCFMSIPPQTVNDIRKGNKIHYCQYCSRILFYPEWEN